MKTIKEIAWIAGILEGEGHFGIYNGSPGLRLKMTDLDVVERATRIMDPSKKVYAYKQLTGLEAKQPYLLTLTGNIAVQWMMTIYSLMGLRRKAKIREILHYWRSKSRKQTVSPSAIKAIMIAKKVSEEEAEKILLESMFKG